MLLWIHKTRLMNTDEFLNEEWTRDSVRNLQMKVSRQNETHAQLSEIPQHILLH